MKYKIQTLSVCTACWITEELEFSFIDSFIITFNIISRCFYPKLYSNKSYIWKSTWFIIHVSGLIVMDACFCHRIKKKKGHVTLISQFYFFLAILIFSHNSGFLRNSLFSCNSDFISRNSDFFLAINFFYYNSKFISRNCDFISYN